MEPKKEKKPDLSTLRWQCRRGMLELDLLLIPFLDNHYANLEEKQQKTFLSLLEFPDAVLYEWFFNQSVCPYPELQILIEKMRADACKP